MAHSTQWRPKSGIRKVNQQSDITGLYSNPNATSTLLEVQDVAYEDAGKVGLQYIFAHKTTVSGIFETMHRYVPADLQFQNERQRNGTWFALSQQLTAHTNINFGWAHAFRTPGDPGQHNSSFVPPGGLPGADFTGGAHANNQANLFTVAYKYQIAKKSWAVCGLCGHDQRALCALRPGRGRTYCDDRLPRTLRSRRRPGLLPTRTAGRAARCRARLSAWIGNSEVLRTIKEPPMLAMRKNRSVGKQVALTCALLVSITVALAAVSATGNRRMLNSLTGISVSKLHE